MRKALLAALAAALVAGCAAPGDLQIRSPAADEPVIVSTSERFAGAVSSLVYRGVEYIDIHDHGRQLQSASSFDLLHECFNPTEAGNRNDRGRPTSRLLAASAGPGWLQTRTDMAFWLPPGHPPDDPCGARGEVRAAVNSTDRGGHILTKRVSFVEGVPNLFAYDAAFFVPERHDSAVFEAATAYLPPEFSARWRLNLRTGALAPAMADGEQAMPVILAMPGGAHAMGVWSPGLPQAGLGYGTFAFPGVVMKWNCVYREKNVAAGTTYRYRCYVAVGTLGEVIDTLRLAAQRYSQPAKENRP
jgi:hypothetical protein